MRIRTTLLTGALLLLASTIAMAQQAQNSQTPQVQSQAGQTTDTLATPEGNLDLGVRFGNLDGDYARFSRYQDFRDKQGALNFKWSREGANYFARFTANNIGYRDQAFNANFVNSRVKAAFEWNQTPLFYGASNTLASPYSTMITGGTAFLTLPAGVQQAIQSGTTYTRNAGGFITGATQSNSALGIATTTAQAAQGTLYRALEQGLDVRSRRDNGKFDLTLQASRDIDLNFSLNTYGRTGTQPWGAAFAFNDAVELPLPIDNRTTDFATHVEWANQKGMVKVGWDGSYFTNNITTLIWANPVRSTDSWNGSSYSNAMLGGAANGRMSLWPNNHANTVNATGLYKLPGHSNVNASLAISSLKQDDTLLPFTINSVMQPGTTLTLSDGTTWTAVAPERPTALADVRLTVGTLNFTTRPNRYFGVTAKYRYSNWDNRTPIFDNPINVRFDGAPESVAGSGTEPGNIKSQIFDADASITPISAFAFRVGFGREGRDLTYRSNTGYNENTFRVGVDSIGNKMFTVRAKYEIARRDAKNAGTLLARDGETEDWAAAVGAQSTSAQFDVASRNRDRATLIFDVTPIEMVGLSVSVFHGKDDYPNINYGLLNNKNTGISFGVDLMPSNFATVSFYYGYEKYDALQSSNTLGRAVTGAALIPGNWNLNNTERVDNYGANIELVKLIPKSEIRFGFDYSKSDQGFIYGGPRIDVMTAGGTFLPLPNIGNKLLAGTFDFRYFVARNVALGVNFLHQKYDVTDWSTPGVISNTYDPIGGLILGYGFRPYNVNVGGVRVIYLF